MPIFINKNNQLHHKVFLTKEEFNEYVDNEYRTHENGMLFSVALIEEITPKDEIEYLLNFLYTQDGEKTIRVFPNNWNSQKIINFLLDKINTDNFLLDLQEFMRDIKEYGNHNENDFNEPYIKG